MKIKNLSFPPALLFILLALFSCQKDDEVVAPVVELMPLEVGNEWVYQITDYDTLGNALSTVSSITRVLKDTTIRNSTWYKLSNGDIVQNHRQGYVYFSRNSKPADQAVTIYQNAETGGIGYGYQYPNYNIWVLTTRNYELSPIPGAIDNLAGYTFQIKKEYSQPLGKYLFTFKQHDYVNPEVGLIRSDRYFIDSDKLMRRTELVKYTLH